MTDTWIIASVVGCVAGAVGLFVVLRGSAFAAHAIPNGAFAGAAGASLVGINSLLGLGSFAFFAALGVAWLGRRGRRDVVTALALVMMLALGAAFLSHTSEYSSEVFSLLFGEVLGVSATAIAPVSALAGACLVLVALTYRPLLLSCAIPEIAESRGLPPYVMELAFLFILALATTMTVPVVGTLLVFSLMIGPPFAARAMSRRPLSAMAISVALALLTVWGAIACSYVTNWPIGFFVGGYGAFLYAMGRVIGARAPARGTSGGAVPAPISA